MLLTLDLFYIVFQFLFSNLSHHFSVSVMFFPSQIYSFSLFQVLIEAKFFLFILIFDSLTPIYVPFISIKHHLTIIESARFLW